MAFEQGQSMRGACFLRFAKSTNFPLSFSKYFFMEKVTWKPGTMLYPLPGKNFYGSMLICVGYKFQFLILKLSKKR